MAAAVTILLAAAISFLAIICNAKFIKTISANVENPKNQLDSNNNKYKLDRALVNRKHEVFIPLVAFECGYRNKYMNKNGKWQDDSNQIARCLQEKHDILNYCKKIYSTMDVTNIVEYSHVSHINGWCKENENECKHQAIVRPYRCIIGEFVSESLQVPSECRFSHIASRSKCNNSKFWTVKAELECSSKTDENTYKKMKLHSSSILDPCGLSMFRGVEYVCCPENVKNKDVKVVNLEKNFIEDDDEDDEDEDDETIEDEDDNEIFKQDPYFKEDLSNLYNEHDRFRDAEKRLENKHRKEVTKLITEWNDSFERYNKMKLKDMKEAEEYKREITSRFRKTVAALEEENYEQRTQLEELHDERVQSALNEKKRQATHDYRAALAKQVKTRNKSNVLKTLKNYIRTEERDRAHMLNRYRHFLRSDSEAAVSFKPILLHRLRYIDLRINGTLAMLHDFPHLEKQIRPVAIEFWNNYRRKNTQILSNDFLLPKSDSLIGNNNKKNERLIRINEELNKLLHPDASTIIPHNNNKQNHLETENFFIDHIRSVTKIKKQLHESAPKPANMSLRRLPTLSGSKTAKKITNLSFLTKTTESILSEDWDEDQFDDDDEEEQNNIMELEKKEKLNLNKKQNEANVNIEFKSVYNNTILPKILNQSKYVYNTYIKKNENNVVDNKNNNYRAISNEENTKEIILDIKPIISAPIQVHEEIEEISPAYSRQDMLIAYNNEFRNVHNQNLSFLTFWTNRTTILISMCTLSIFVFFALLLTKRRLQKHPGFIEIDVCTPEERHVAGMQINGYENPTYSYFEVPIKT